MEYLETILPLLTPFGVIVFGAVFLYIQAKQWGLKAGNEVIETYRAQVTQLKEQIAAMWSEVISVRSELDKMRWVIEEKDKVNKDLRAIIEARNPDMQTFYKEALPALRDISTYFKEFAPIMEKMEEYLLSTK